MGAMIAIISLIAVLVISILLISFISWEFLNPLTFFIGPEFFRLTILSILIGGSIGYWINK